ncbi:MAG: homogentisate 1,2-dioxygenase, partial [Candidatus Kapabacteria bacterium]|nr:homogentisate 1,2-dioxygenase [Candidatus Kapabacteria bacterium]
MIMYKQVGSIPHKRHTVFRQPNGSLYHEELFGTQGFSGASTLLYHVSPPTIVRDAREPFSVRPDIAIHNNMKALSFQGFKIEPDADYLESRKVLFVNNDLHIGLAGPTASMTGYFFKNADADEMLFVHKGTGTLHTVYGSIDFEYGDYLIIPRGTTYQLHFETTDNHLLIVESFTPIRIPRRYRNENGQLLEHSPYCERDFRVPENLITHDEKGDFELRIKKNGLVYPYTYGTHPFDVVGWDGFCYPVAFSIFDFEPITGRVHMPPP